MITIDKAIAQEKELFEHCKRIYESLSDEDKSINPLLKNEMEYHKQLAEWLEELKAYRTLDKTNFSDGYNKAIDDFTEKLNAKCDGMIKEQWNSNVAPISWAEAYADFKDDIEEIAEQLKAGGADGNIQ